MLNWLNIVMLILTVGAVVFGCLQWLAARKTPDLKVLVYPAIPLMNTEGPEARKLSVAYNGKVVRHLSTTGIEIINSGNVPLTDADFVEKVNISFGSECLLLDLTTYSRDYMRGSIVRVCEVSDHQADLVIPLLNPGDKVFIQFVCAECPAGSISPSISARVVGIPRIKVQKVDDPFLSLDRVLIGPWRFRLFFISCGAIITLVLSVLTISLIPTQDLPTDSLRIRVLGISLGISLLGVLIFSVMTFPVLFARRRRNRLG